MRAATVTMAAAILALTAGAPVAGAEPGPGEGTGIYMIGRCFDPSQPVVERPVEVEYSCDGNSIMEQMAWTAWGPDGASGFGMDNSVECKPDCAEGPHLRFPIVVHAWNPKAPTTPGCPAGVEFFSDLTVAYPVGVPPWVVPGTSWGPGVDYTYVDGMPAVHFSDPGPHSCTPLPH